MNNLTILTEDQNSIDVLFHRGVHRAAITDFSILLGGYVSDYYVYPYGTHSLKDRTGEYWTSTVNSKGNACVITSMGYWTSHSVRERRFGVRPALPFSSISGIPMNGSKAWKRAKDGILEVEYGYYPQYAASVDMQSKLEEAFTSRSLSTTGKGYTIDSKKYDAYDEKFEPKRLEEYQYNRKKYVRVEANPCVGKGWYESVELSNEKSYIKGDNVWVEVSPVKWLVDEKEKIMVTERLIFAGIQFNHTDDYLIIKNLDFDETDIKMFMDKYLFKELIQSVKTINSGEEQEEIEDTETIKSRLQRLNPDNTNPSSITNMTDTELIHNWIESGESVLLRGPSGIGKTERIKSLYPDLVYIKLTNNMFPEKVVGSINLQTGQSIPPDYAKTIIMQEATEEERKLIEKNIQNIYDIADTVYERSKESNNKIVILLDELLNVKPAVQSLVYTLILNRIVEIGKGLKLPDNVVIVATGNQKKYSIVAEDLAEPLEKRFDHILDMEPKVGEWITEYAIPHKVHPAVIGYILSKYNSSGKREDKKHIGYFYEEPEVGEEHLDSNGCRGRTNDPRGWTSISNTLYNFERNLISR